MHTSYIMGIFFAMQIEMNCEQSPLLTINKKVAY